MNQQVHHTPTPRRPISARAALVGAVLTPALLLGSATSASAGVTGPWSTPVALSATGADTVHVAEVRTAGNGDVVAATFRQSPGSAQTDLLIAIRPAGSAVWGAPAVVDTLPAGTANARLFSAPDGSTTLTWVKVAAAQNTIRTASLAAGATAFSAPVDIAAGADYIAPATAVGAGGRAVTTWIRQGDRVTDVYVSERATAGGAWSAPVKLDTTPAETLESSLEPLVAADGTATVLWNEGRPDGSSVVASDLVAGATGWTAPRSLSGPANETAVPRAAVAPDGSAVLSWLSTPAGSFGPQSLDVLVRPAGSTQWGAPQQAATVEYAAASRPLIGPDGEITLVWRGYGSNGFGIHASTRSPATGAWSPVTTLSPGYPRDEFDAEIGPDGSAHVLWTQQDSSGFSQVVHYAGRSGGAWSPAVALMAQPSGVAEGHVAGGPAGRTTAVWQDSPDGVSGKVWSAGTGL
ncbi:hypothetical protein ACIQ9E_09225 [Streptomyces sp. NPDC094448]|uniref:hypothetical protein n=1 Tax=Streptomyces sp. NPDC094448 TaxID=3366063 RepID=UPI00382E9602